MQALQIISKKENGSIANAPKISDTINNTKLFLALLKQ